MTTMLLLLCVCVFGIVPAVGLWWLLPLHGPHAAHTLNLRPRTWEEVQRAAARRHALKLALVGLATFALVSAFGLWLFL